MSTEPDFLPVSPPPIPDEVAVRVTIPSEPATGARRQIPNFGHTVLFFTVAIVVLLITSICILAIAMGFHLMGTETPEQLLREPRLLIPSMAVAYLIAGAVVWAVFTYMWDQPFTQGLRWNFSTVRRRWVGLLAGGIVLSLVVQFLSNFLPVPKTLPIDDFFRTPVDVWMVALFGTFVAPVFEELAFRGFLLPSLASSWDWLTRRPKDRLVARPDIDGYVSPVTFDHLPATKSAGACGDPRWSVPALVFSCTLTSIAFALVHADQLAHAWAPLAVLFGVSLVLCWVRLWTQSLAASTLIHATYNGTIFTILFFGTGGFRHLDKIR